MIGYRRTKGWVGGGRLDMTEEILCLFWDVGYWRGKVGLARNDWV